MKKLFLIKNPILFQGKKYLKKNKNYFEGWYYKNTNSKEGISFIPGISINENERIAFIQIIINSSSYFIKYNIEEFKYSHKPFYIKIGDNHFSQNKIHINIKDTNQNLIVKGDINYIESKNVKTNFLNPNIMGPFSYIPFMECNHAILSMKNKANGTITINDKLIAFKNDIGYIEKDWGTSFPKTYIWCQANNFSSKKTSFMLSIADIPFKLFHFRGFICSLIAHNKEYRFATYNNAKIIKYEVNKNKLNIILKKGEYYLYINSKYNNGHKLIAPIKGKMTKDIIESISERVTITLKKDNKIIFKDISNNCGLEIVN